MVMGVLHKNQAWTEFLCSFGPKPLRAWYLLVPAVVAVACAWSWLGKAASPIHVAGICSVRVSPAVMEFTASFIAVRALVTASRSLLVMMSTAMLRRDRFCW